MLDKYIKTKAFSYIYSIVLFAIAVCIILVGWDGFGGETGGIVLVNKNMYTGIQILVLITAVMLVVSSRLTDAMQPAMMIVVLATACYDSADEFTSPSFLWVAVPAVFAVIFHFIKYRKPFRIGKSFWGLCAVTVAVTLGGIGSISASDYFGGSSMFYVLGLGIGMVVFYLLVKSQAELDTPQSIARVMYLVGMLAAFSILWVYVSNWDLFLYRGKFLRPQFSNNLSTLIMMAMPFPLLYSSKRYVDFVSVLLMYSAMVFSSSRAGLLMGTVELIVLLIVYSAAYQKGVGGIVRRVMFLGTLVAFFGAVWYVLPQLATLGGASADEGVSRIDIVKQIFDGFISSGETRVQLLGRMKGDFASNPIFGVGLGYTGNSDIYNPVKGAMNWYHMWVPQVVGSLGIVGILAYGYQLVSRTVIFVKNRSLMNLTLFMSYVGLWLMSQVNPGEFCPAPYAMLAVTYFAFMENPDEDIFLVEKFEAIKKSLKNRRASATAEIE
ncbi:MAG: hypothetical protein IJX74_07510 [Clostridia bacterium]|nr:hypothetical protein [Clostridia bacterium]